MRQRSLTSKKLKSHIALCGARGCIRECVVHLEKRKKLLRSFKAPFRVRKQWGPLLPLK
jgi:hypothetical protein